MGVYVGVDYGTKRIGLAVSDTGGMFAAAEKTLGASGRIDQDARAILAFADEQEAEHLVVGLPLNMDDTESKQTVITKQFASHLAKQTDLPVTLYDERLSSWAADQAFDEAGLTRGKRKAKRDAVAAQIMLQDFLDAQQR